MLATASNGWGHFFLALPPLLDLEHFLQIISQIILLFHPQPLDAHNSIQWLGTFFLAPPPLLHLEHFLQIISQIILLFHLGTFFLGTTTPSALRAFFTNNFTNYIPISSPTIACSQQHPMVGDIFFGTTTLSGLINKKVGSVTLYFVFLSCVLLPLHWH